MQHVIWLPRKKNIYKVPARSLEKFSFFGDSIQDGISSLLDMKLQFLLVTMNNRSIKKTS